MLPTLKIKDFSCIDYAEIQISELTLLVGPQASGKSVISKLVYFFLNSIDSAVDPFLEELESTDRFLKSIGEQFKKWFPSIAWGKKRFEIVFTLGSVEFRIARTAFNKLPSRNVRVSASHEFIAYYEKTVEAIRKASKQKTSAKDEFKFREAEGRWRVLGSARRELAQIIGREPLDSQVFIPAGRSFFTSFGKTITAFEHGGLLDQPTIRFGRLFAQLRDRSIFYMPEREKPDREFDALRKNLSESLLGGVMKSSKESEYIESKDGRQVPYSFLSSGQQELLPLLLVLDVVAQGNFPASAFYIEEPEAHLFPSAQGLLTEYLTLLVNRKLATQLFVTTHSPYLLTKFNNLLKAGIVSTKFGKRVDSRIDAIIRKDRWIRPGKLVAYSIVDREVRNLIGDDGLIDGSYLDEVSSSTAQEFDALLGVEYSDRR